MYAPRVVRSKKYPLTAAKVDLVLPTDSWGEKLDKLVKERQKPHHYKINATLGHFLEKDFFTEHVKSGRLTTGNQERPLLTNCRKCICII